MDPLGSHDPRRVGPYRLVGRLGAGGMGLVYLGKGRSGELVAVKVVHPGFAYDERFRVRFRREVEISRRVTGPWVAAVVDADTDAELPWLATQYVRGPSLAAAVDGYGPLPADVVQVLAHGLALALGAIHDAGLVHRDLKPTNVLLDSDHPRLIDFGISRAVDDTQVTSTGIVIGTPAFMSPEQITGGDVGPASDVFSLGSVLCYAATGRSPFGEAPPVVLMVRISQHEPDLDAVPAAVRAPVAACLAKRPEDRPTATELGAMLGTVAPARGGWLPPPVAALAPAGTPTLPDAPPGESHLRGGSATGGRTSRRVVLLSALGVGVAAVAGVGVALAGGGRAPDPAPAPTAPPAPAPARADGLPAPRVRWTVPVDEPDQLYRAAAADGRHVYLVTQGGSVLALDAASGAERWSSDGWPGQSASLTLVDGAVLVTAGGAFAALDAVTGRRWWQAAESTRYAPPSVADGVAVASSTDGLAAMDVVTGERLWTAERFGEEPDIGVVAGGGRCFTAYGSVQPITAREVRTGQVLWSYDPGVEPVEFLPSFALATDVVIVAYSATIVAVEASTGRPRWRTAEGNRPGAKLFVTGDVLVAYTAPLDAPAATQGLDLATGSPRWSVRGFPSGGYIEAVEADGTVYMIDPQDMSVQAHTGATGVPRWAYGDQRGRYLPAAAHGPDVYVYDWSAGLLHALSAP